MRITARLLASVSSGSSRYLRPGNPTGLTGLLTHPCPRSSLIYLYAATLDKLSTLPESSAYRTAAEALTNHRLKIVSSYKPEQGYESWASKVQKTVDDHPELFRQTSKLVKLKGNEKWLAELAEGERFQAQGFRKLADERVEEWDGAPDGNFSVSEAEIAAVPSGKVGPDALPANEVEELEKKHETLKAEEGDVFAKDVVVERGPALDATQISEIEEKIGAGLIEEVIQVAEGEFKLVDEMIESKVWEDLAEKPAPGQWEYFAREQHMDPESTQAPPSK